MAQINFRPAAAPTQPQQGGQQGGGDWTDLLPAGLGIGGQVLGGVVGGVGGFGAGAAVPGADVTGVPEVAGAIGGERIGQTVGGAAGQGLGEFIRQLIKGKGFDPRRLLGETAQGGVFGMVPGSEGAKLPELLTRGAVGGAAMSGIQSLEEGKPITAAGTGSNAAAMAGLNAIAPGVGKILGKVGGTVFPEAGRLMNELATRFFGDEAAKDPEILSHLDTVGGWKATRDSLVKGAQDAYEKLNAALKPKTVTIGEYLDRITSGLPSNDIESRSNQIRNAIAQKVGGELKQLTNDYARIVRQAGTSPSMARGPAAMSRRALYQSGQRLAEKIDSTPVTGDIINSIQHTVVNDWFDEAKPAYTAGKNFIEELAGKDTPTAAINQTYRKLMDTANFMTKKFSRETAEAQMGRSMNFLQRAGLVGLGSIFAQMMHLPASVYGPIGAPLLVGAAAKEALSRSPEAAAQFAKVAAPVEQAGQKAVQAAIPRQAGNVVDLLKQFAPQLFGGQQPATQ